MIQNPKISIIVPVYKAEKYLRQCLDSILEQTFEDWECILVDDGSPDNSGSICEGYAKNDPRFRVIHKENGGVSTARNEGLKQTNGEWVYFIDSDDTLYPDALYTFSTMIGDSVDAIMAGYIVLQEYYDKITLKQTSFVYSQKSVHEALKEMFKPTDFYYQGYLWCKLFKKSIIINHSLKFHEAIYYNEDRLFIVEYLCKCVNRIAYTTKPVYGYVDRSSGAMNSLKQNYNSKFVTDFAAYCKMYDVISSFTNDIQLISYVKEGISHSFQQNMRLMEKFHEFNKEGFVYMRKEMYKTGGMKFLILSPIRTFVANILRIFWPSVIVKQKFNKNK